MAKAASQPPTGSKQVASCSMCGKPVDPAYKPFCSKRCANLDLHRWMKGSYVIAGQSEAEEPDEPLAEHEPPHDDF
jgi:endogenous inhibitor of DNA gyrase (YacG/DUF329 family)